LSVNDSFYTNKFQPSFAILSACLSLLKNDIFINPAISTGNDLLRASICIEHRYNHWKEQFSQHSQL